MNDKSANSHLHNRGDFRPAAAWETLAARARLLQQTRRFFDRHGYTEVETPLLSRDVLVDAHIDPFVVPDGNRGELFLQTSPEFAMKRLLASGAPAIYQITRAFRRGEIGRLHNPEFTIVEWYQTDSTPSDQMNLTERLVRDVFRTALPFRIDVAEKSSSDRNADWLNDGKPFERIAYDDAFRKFAGETVLDSSTTTLSALANRHGIAVPDGLDDDDRDGWLNLLLAEIVEPYLGRKRPIFLYDYPASQAALSVVRQDDPPVAERFELYVDGIELCNGYHELRDPAEFRERIRQQQAVRQREGLCPLPEQNRLLAAMEAGLPACTGVALGFDRLVMLALGADSLAKVTAFPGERA